MLHIDMPACDNNFICKRIAHLEQRVPHNLRASPLERMYWYVQQSCSCPKT